MAETIWSVFPPILTIVLALATKEVYMSLLIGIFSGAMLYSNFNVIQAILTMFAVMEEKVGGNVNILVFLVVLTEHIAVVGAYDGRLREEVVGVDEQSQGIDEQADGL